jgi:antagonist of KipI
VTLVVLEPGMLSTVQDLGRFGHGVLGVPAGGAADPVSLRIGNLLVGNPEGSPGIEMTLTGASFRAEALTVVALCGSDFEASIGRFTPVALHAGDVVRIGATRAGARCTLCVRGGVDVPRALGSASTHLPSGIGGLEGRPLRKGDVIPVGADPGGPRRRLVVALPVVDGILGRRVLRVTPGPQESWFARESVTAFFEGTYEITEEADRAGLRLDGPALARTRSGELVTEGVCLGAVQVPDVGQPIVLFVDQRTTGGYPKIANVIMADHAALGQLRPRARVRFARASLAEAWALLEEQERVIAEATEPA